MGNPLAGKTGEFAKLLLCNPGLRQAEILALETEALAECLGFLGPFRVSADHTLAADDVADGVRFHCSTLPSRNGFVNHFFTPAPAGSSGGRARSTQILWDLVLRVARNPPVDDPDDLRVMRPQFQYLPGR